MKINNFTEKEFEVIKYLTDGLNNIDIANKMFVTTATVKAHMTSIMRKLGVENRTAVAIIAIVLGFVDYREIDFLKPFLLEREGPKLNVEKM